MVTLDFRHMRSTFPDHCRHLHKLCSLPERGGAMDGPGLLSRFGRERILKHIIWSRELAFRGRWIEEYEREMRKPPTRLTIIYDLQGMNSRHLKPGVLPLLNEAMKLTQLRYNGIAKVSAAVSWASTPFRPANQAQFDLILQFLYLENDRNPCTIPIQCSVGSL
jgi:hypothetical protein